ncbi:MAG: cadherin-like domain-containing protein, partial [Verrucomicrobiota bacterium]|nr:cadherin-like domain-containing protein [Verrucomicrobiota bacterium]
MKTFNSIFLFGIFTLSFGLIVNGQTYIFSNAGATGREGPTQADINASYAGTNLDGTVTINTQGIQAWTVPASGTYQIEAYGAKGGGDNGGLGAKIIGTFSLSQNEVINIIVGQSGTVTNQGSSYGAGGGGASYIFKTFENLLMVAGGGGGQAQEATGGNGSDSETPTNSTGTQGNGSGGTGGNGGDGGSDQGQFSTGGGGAGWNTDGSDGLNIRNAPGKGGLSPSNGSIGGEFTHPTASYHSGNAGDGGFGGGGGMSDNTGAGGGGGGYNGGGGGNNYSASKWGAGGGGGSYNSGTDQNNTAGVNTGHGQVIITRLSYTFTNAGATGREGPTQADINSNYAGTNLDGGVTINTRGIQEWIVPFTGNYQIEAYGAEGGASNSQYLTGKGSIIKGIFSLATGQQLNVLVGQHGESGTFIGGGGGGSYVWKASSDEALIIAGGGGGQSYSTDGGNALVTQNGGNGTDLSQGGGINGHGSSNPGVTKYGAGGAGWLSDGYAGSSPGFNGSIATGGQKPLNGGTGGTKGGNSNSVGDGGFGGGGGAQGRSDAVGSGGGGGYSGGSGGPEFSGIYGGGGGGGSYNSGTDQNNTAGANTGHGKVVITLLSETSSNASPVITQGSGPLTKAIDEDTNASWLSNELNATDADTNASQLAWSILSNPSNGTANIDGNGTSPSSLTYQPNANFHGSDSFSVQVSDGEGNDSITINLTINAVDDASIVSGDTNASISEDSSASGDLNATDADGLSDGSVFAIAYSPSNGSATIHPSDGNWTYSPNPNFFGSDSFQVSVTDDLNSSSVVTITISVSSIDD